MQTTWNVKLSNDTTSVKVAVTEDDFEMAAAILGLRDQDAPPYGDRCTREMTRHLEIPSLGDEELSKMVSQLSMRTAAASLDAE